MKRIRRKPSDDTKYQWWLEQNTLKMDDLPEGVRFYIDPLCSCDRTTCLLRKALKKNKSASIPHLPIAALIPP